MRISRLPRRLACALALSFLLPATGAFALEADFLQEPNGESPVTASNLATARIEYFNWREYDGDTRLLKESGPRLQLGASRRYNREDITFTPHVEGMFGYVDYDGHTQGGTPVSTDVRYVGFGIGADIGAVYHFVAESQVEPYLGLGWNYWRRDLRTTSQATGYLETWDSVFARGGARAEADLVIGATPVRGYGELGLKLPLSTYNSAKFPGVGKVNVSPKGNLSLYGSVGIVKGLWRGGLFYDGWRFQASDVTPAGGGAFGLMQPKSRADIFGIEAARAF